MKSRGRPKGPKSNGKRRVSGPQVTPPISSTPNQQATSASYSTAAPEDPESLQRAIAFFDQSRNAFDDAASLMDAGTSVLRNLLNVRNNNFILYSAGFDRTEGVLAGAGTPEEEGHGDGQRSVRESEAVGEGETVEEGGDHRGGRDGRRGKRPSRRERRSKREETIEEGETVEEGEMAKADDVVGELVQEGEAGKEGETGIDVVGESV